MTDKSLLLADEASDEEVFTSGDFKASGDLKAQSEIFKVYCNGKIVILISKAGNEE